MPLEPLKRSPDPGGALSARAARAAACRRRLCSILAGLTGSIAATPLASQPVPPLPASVSNATPAAPSAPSPSSGAYRSPVDEFRHLLRANPAERERILEQRWPGRVQALRSKLAEYDGLPPDERELRLRTLELRYHLLPLMRMPREQRAPGLSRVPPEYRDLVDQRLVEWDLLPPDLQKEALENESTRHYFVQLDMISPAQQRAWFARLPPDRRDQLEEGFRRWQSLSPEQRQLRASGIDRFFQLGPDARQKVLESLSETELARVQPVLEALPRLPPDQRRQYVVAFEKFVALSPPERERFLQNAERWKTMSPEERQLWRELVEKLPPLPPGMSGDFLFATP
ncbi:MAG TPA: DUF3106 domain-containing protein [Candidatus Paceibacterota bacterium]|nr:DUF3106 domain-containing protein [Verrucomicrobiota bacterium]HOX02898.1 DUF3106 domain-containing protein [Verrucomicrobiota bacterium]HRZ45650.1 DUF3106 domain-containing protein [Candidatus Paceibacterota bacterium]HRZ91836.1 DUF3106 domain-containing protein [Candidatus Paceibacterota bacterium]